MKVSGGGKAKWQYNLVTFAYMKFDYRQIHGRRLSNNKTPKETECQTPKDKNCNVKNYLKI